MITSIAILIVSVALLAYWFRYSCLLILGAKTARDYSGVVAQTKCLNFLEVHGALAGAGAGSQGIRDLDALEQALAQDYRKLCSTSCLKLLMSAEADLETAMVCADYQLMRACYAALRIARPAMAHNAVAEMTEIIRYFANCHGQKAQLARASV